MVGVFVPIGLDKGVIKYSSLETPRDIARSRAVIVAALRVVVSSALSVSLAIAICATVIGTTIPSRRDMIAALVWFAPAMAAYPILRVLAATTIATKRMKYSIVSQDLLPPALALSTFIILFYGWGLKLSGAIIALTLAYMISLLTAAHFAWRLYAKSANKEEGSTDFAPSYGRLLFFSLPAALAGISTMFLQWVDRLIVAYYYDPSQVGAYQVASQCSLVLGLGLASLAGILAPIVASLGRIEDRDTLNEVFKVATKWGLYLVLPVFVAICAYSNDIIVAIYGPQYQASAIPFLILSSGQLVNAATGAVGLVLIMTGHQWQWLTISGSCLGVGILLDVLLVPRYGNEGAAAGTALTLSVLFCIGLLTVWKRLGIWPYDIRYSKGLIATSVSAIVMVGLKQVLTLSAMWNALLAVTISTSVFVAALSLMGIAREDREGILSLLSSIRTMRG
jgi:O-antigen/teichoic acid export membrane protein